jgi:hypothetical protein
MVADQIDILGRLVAAVGTREHAEALTAIAAEVVQLGDALSDAQTEIASLRADAVLGAIVRRMPAGIALCRYESDVPWRVADESPGRYDTPEAAIRAAMLREADIHE